MRNIYHITHVSNLKGIVDAGGLWCDSQRAQLAMPSIDIAHATLKQRRRSKHVPVAAGGTLADYVPFYFTVRSPMLYALAQRAVETYQGSQEEIIYLVISIERVFSSPCQWCFTDGHAVEAFSRFFDDLAMLDGLDWDIIADRNWADTSIDPDRKRRKQAEFLIYQFVPWTWIAEIAVASAQMAMRVNQILGSTPNRPAIRTRTGWYYR